jgi:15-cis-phytoene synthase
MTMPSAFDHCTALVREFDRDRYLATLFAPAERRAALHALYAFNIEIARVREVAREPMPGEIRLQWWREVLAGERLGEARANPVAAALIEALLRYKLAREPLTQVIDAHAFDLYDEPMQSLGDLTRYAIQSEGVVFGYACRMLGADEQAIGTRVMNAGIAATIASILSRLAWHAARRQLYVPLLTLTQHGVERETVFAGRSTEALSAALAVLRARARWYLGLAEAAPMLPRIVPALLPLALVGPTLARMERTEDPFRFTPLPLWRRQWLLWRAARNPKRIFRA